MFVSLCLIILLSSIPISMSDSYYRGTYRCESFQNTEDLYRSDPNSIYLRIEYAGCLLVRGDDTEALSILHDIAYQHNSVKVAHVIAEYIETGGIFDRTTVDDDNIDEAIEAYRKVLSFIDLNPEYPENEYMNDEEQKLIDLISHYSIPKLYFHRYLKGAQGTDSFHLLRSPSYAGDGDLNTYPAYAPYTMESLNNMLRFSNICTSLPFKGFHEKGGYDRHMNACRALKEASIELLPLEEERLVLLGTESCTSDITKCVDHRRIEGQMVIIIKDLITKINEIF